MKPEKEEEKEDREKRRWEKRPLDTDPAKLKIIARREGPPEIRPFKLASIGPDFTIGFFGKRRGQYWSRPRIQTAARWFW